MMTTFIVRIQLRNSEKDDYEKLHEKMENNGFYRYIENSLSRKYKLPDAEYLHKNQIYSTDTILDKAYKIAESIKINPSVLVSKINEIKHKGLDN